MHHDEANQLGQYIPLHYHHHMLGDLARTSTFKAAIASVVPLGGRVLELGSGTGVLSSFAAQRAAQVTAIEFNPQLVKTSRSILEQNGCSDKVTVLHADASSYMPPEPVDAVICEMLHSALLREKQLEIIRGFKQRYQARFASLPRFIPEATILAAQPMWQNYSYLGYNAPLPLFQDAASHHERSGECAPPLSYACIDYHDACPEHFEANLRFEIAEACEVNAVRFVTKNLLAILPQEQRSIDWNNQHLVLPLQEPINAAAGDCLEIHFAYQAGGSIESLSETLRCARVN